MRLHFPKFQNKFWTLSSDQRHQQTVCCWSKLTEIKWNNNNISYLFNSNLSPVWSSLYSLMSAKIGLLFVRQTILLLIHASIELSIIPGRVDLSFYETRLWITWADDYLAPKCRVRMQVTNTYDCVKLKWLHRLWWWSSHSTCSLRLKVHRALV